MGIQPFRFWCQHVLPAVYDDSLSYYELLCKVVRKLNETIGATNATSEGVEQLTNFVNNYFAKLDVQSEIDNKLDSMAESGVLSDIINEQLFGDINNRLNNTNFLNVKDNGAVGDGITDDTEAIQNTITLCEENGFSVYIPTGVYKISRPLEINKTLSVYCLGGLYSPVSDCIYLNAIDSVIKIYSIIGNGNYTRFKYGSENMNMTYGNSNINIQFINNFNNGVVLYSNNGYGNQHNIFNLNRIDNCNNALVFECGDIGVNWVNENYFYNLWCAGFNKPNSRGLITKKGAQQIDPFNSNNFVNVSFEATRYPIYLEFANNNTFTNMRMFENQGDELIVCINSNFNKFRGSNAVIDINSIRDESNNNIYEMVALKNLTQVATKFTYRDTYIIPLDGYTAEAININADTLLQNGEFPTVFIVDSTDNPCYVGLSPVYSYSAYIDGFYVITKKPSI